MVIRPLDPGRNRGKIRWDSIGAAKLNEPISSNSDIKIKTVLRR